MSNIVFRKFDWHFLMVILALHLIGLLNLYSATHGPQSVEVETLFSNQIIWITMGWSLLIGLTVINYHFLAALAPVFYVLNLGAILFVTLFGNVALGAQRWIDFGFFKYQPSETMKLAIILMLAKIFASRAHDPRGMDFKDLVLPLVILLVPFGLVVEQPDLGTGLMLAFIAGSMFVFMKLRTRVLVVAVVTIATAVPLAWEFGLREYQRQRVLNFLTPGKDPRGTGYNSIQSRIAVGSGQLVGKGFQKGTQSQLQFLPERHTDFIFSVLSEEHGLLGGLGTIGLFILLISLGLQIASTARDKFGCLVTVGVMSYLFWHMFVNIGMVTGLLPIVGVPLPLVSYGGSSMISTMVGLGLVSSVAFRRYLF